MERLTKIFDNNKYRANCDICERYGINCGLYPCRGRFVDRLGVIEDVLGDTYDLSRLKELVEADRKGWVMIVHPDPVGEQGERGISIEDEERFSEWSPE